MIRLSSRLSRLSVVAAIAIVAAAPALGEKALLKLGDVKGESTDDKHKGEIEVESFSWGAAGNPTTPVHSADPQEGGEVISEPGKLETPNLRSTAKVKVSDIPIVKRPDKGSPVLQSSDPEEGGEVAAKLRGSATPKESVFPRYEVTSPRDVASGQATGKRQHKPLTMERGSLTAIIPDGACVLGARYPTVTLQADGQLYELSDVTVASCQPVAAAKGKKDKAQLEYMHVKMETILISS